MAIQFWKDMSILEDAVQLAGHGKSVNLATEVAPLDTTPLSTSGYVTLIGGLKTGTVSLGLMADFAEAHDSTFWANLGATGVVRSICTASADGSVAYLMTGIGLQYTPIEGNVGDLAMAAVSGRQSGSPVIRGRVLHPEAARTSSDVGTERELGTVAAGKSLYAALHVLEVSGTNPTLDVLVQSDATGFASPTTQITFAQATAAGAQFLSVAGPITDDFFRASWTIGGTDTPTFTFIVTCGFI